MMASVPNQPRTPTSTFRIPVDLKDAAAAIAKEEGRTLTAVIVEALERYVGREDTDAVDTRTS